MKVSELSGPLLREWVARANGWKIERDGDHEDATLICWDEKGEPFSFGEFGYCPDKNWAHGGPILDELIRSGEWLIGYMDGNVMMSNSVEGESDGDMRQMPVKDGSPMQPFDSVATTLLVAACRAKVFSVYGDEVPDTN